MKPADLEPFELMQIMAMFFETHAIPYRVVGSLASMAFGEPRFTNDIDIAAELTMNHVQDLCRSFPTPEYYLSEPAQKSGGLSPRLILFFPHPSGRAAENFRADDQVS